MRRALPSALAAVIGAASVVIAVACSDMALNMYCTGIPDGGCPGDDSTNCADTTCAAIYTCQSGTTWTFVQKCPGYVPPHDAGVDGDGATTDAVVPGEGPLHDAGFALPEGAAGGPGCDDLESPDCPLEVAAECGTFCCGCETLYVCVDGGWNSWGECDDAGAIVEDPAP